jgi:hypothetical protein
MKVGIQSLRKTKGPAIGSVKARSSALSKFGDSTALSMTSIVLLLISSAVFAAAVRTHNPRTANGVLSTKPLTVTGTTQSNSTPERISLRTRLSLQPEADRLRRTLGKRFLAPGYERANTAGTLSVGAKQYQVRIVRTQTDDGEVVEIVLGGEPALLTWSWIEGAKSGARLANGVERSLIERVTLDSPDQFIQAQLRMASYYTIARNVMPPEANGGDEYNGPVWDVVRITEPKGEGGGRPLGPIRHYFLNSSTGLPEKVVSDEQGQTIVAELSGWINQGGELLPTRIVWSRDKQIIMELTVKGFFAGPGA